jgi:dihydroorotate dehydrogenase electron transfer subunit
MIEIGEIIHQHKITDNVVLARISAPEIANEAKPGQFVHVRIQEGIDPLLRRPFSLHRVPEKSGEIELLYRVVGRGTQLLSEKTAGARIDLMGPLGHGFDLTGSFSHALIVAGGMGGAPVFFLIDELLKLKKQVTLLWGVRDGQEIFHENEFQSLGVQLQIATEDASKGYCGQVTELLSEYMRHSPFNGSRGYVCGPECMIREVQKIVKNLRIRWQVSMEQSMACAIGVCLGCAIRTVSQGIQMVCQDGPVFELEEIVFDV